MVRFVGGVVVGILVGSFFGWVLGVFYAVEAIEPTLIMKYLATLKGLM
ncbi:hypothetical protein [Halalkalibacter krulwichiae]|uniref:Uncharacterized protein n=1 Tax=Halalkalibacter krulwichiae TaxID=199441 RepID=A0A1X9MEG0_9BACI|nr:hypothetical protein [Halalkalibacter krulwichiae]ARK28822.1 hypothetical protein BkAM31D_02560 [Halalkalibacter krulwichiae]